MNRAVLSVAAAATPAPAPACPTVAQNGSSNIAKLSVTTGSSQSCTITQNATGAGTNTVQLAETIQQGSGTSQTASQDAQVTQTSVTGSNSLQISQKVTQSISESATAVTESQVSDQTYSVNQTVTQSTSTVGTNKSQVDQSLSQTQNAPNATSGSQYQRANLTGHVDQFSHALSSSQNNQTENQSEFASPGSAVLQTQVGPTRCCTSQGDNPADVFKARQTLSQTNNSANRSFTEDAQIDLSTSGNATANQAITQNGQTTTNSSSGQGSANLGTTCTQGTCTPTSGGFPSGNVFVSVGQGQVQEWKPDGTFVQTLDTTTNSAETTGLAFDASGNLYVTDWTASDVTKFTSAGSLAGSFGTGYDASHPESIDFDASGNAYVGEADAGVENPSLLKFNSAGAPLASFSPAAEVRGTDWIDLAPDQCTLYYTSEGNSVKTFNVCTNMQGSDFATGLPGSAAYTIRLLPGGGALVADFQTIVRLDASGQVVQQYDDADATSFWFSLALDPDGKTFWAGDYSSGRVDHFDIASGALLSHFTTNPVPGSIDQAGGLAIAP